MIHSAWLAPDTLHTTYLWIWANTSSKKLRTSLCWRFYKKWIPSSKLSCFQTLIQYSRYLFLRRRSRKHEVYETQRISAICGRFATTCLQSPWIWRSARGLSRGQTEQDQTNHMDVQPWSCRLQAKGSTATEKVDATRRRFVASQPPTSSALCGHEGCNTGGSGVCLQPIQSAARQDDQGQIFWGPELHYTTQFLRKVRNHSYYPHKTLYLRSEEVIFKRRYMTVNMVKTLAVLPFGWMCTVAIDWWTYKNSMYNVSI